MACPAPSLVVGRVQRSPRRLLHPPGVDHRDHLTDPRVQHVSPMEDVACQPCASLTRLRSNDEPDPPARSPVASVRGRGRPYAASRGGPPTRHRYLLDRIIGVTAAPMDK